MFPTRCQKVQVEGDLNLQMKLDVDPLVSEELRGMLVSPVSQK